MKFSFPQFRSLPAGRQACVRKVIGTFAIILVFIVYLLASTKVLAIYDPRTVPNNKAGVHILSPSEITSAANLVNSQGGDWGYVTIPIQPTDRDKDKWQTFMH